MLFYLLCYNYHIYTFLCIKELLRKQQKIDATSCGSGSLTAIPASARAASISISPIPIRGVKSNSDRSSTAPLTHSIFRSGNGYLLFSDNIRICKSKIGLVKSKERRSIHRVLKHRNQGKKRWNLRNISSNKHLVPRGIYSPSDPNHSGADSDTWATWRHFRGIQHAASV